MTGSAATVVAEIAGKRHLITLDKGHRLEIRPIGGQALVVESRPVTEFSASVDNAGKVHIAAWLLSRHMMYYTSADGDVFTRSTLLKSDTGLRLKDCLITSGEDVEVAYVAETEHTDTLVCYRYAAGDWEGRRIVEVEHPGRLTALQFDGASGGTSILYGTKEQGRTVVTSRLVSSDVSPEVVATVTGSLTDFCALTSGGARQSCWIVDGYLTINGLRQTEEPWIRSWPCLKREVSGMQCLWLENDTVCGMALGSQRTKLRPLQNREALTCMLALPGELRRAIVDGRSLQEVALNPDMPERAPGASRSTQQSPARPETHRSAQGDVTLTDVVRNQAIYITRMQESLSSMERNMLRVQAEVNRLTREISSVVRAREVLPRPERQYNVASVGEPQDETEEQPMVKATEVKLNGASEAELTREAREERQNAAGAGEAGDSEEGYTGA